MAYTTKALVQSMFRNLKVEATGTVITDDEITQFIEDADAWIDAKLKRYYEVPITGTESLKIVGVISRYRVAHTIKGILELTEQKSDKVQDVQGNLGKQAAIMLEELIPHYNCKCKRWEDAKAPLPDTDLKPIPPVASSVTKAPTTPRTFYRGGNNW